MQIRNNLIESVGRYRYPAIVLHWILALLIPTMIGLGWYMLSIEKQPNSGWYFALHMSLGLTAAFLIASRLVWRLGHSPDALPASVPAWQAKMARATHVLLYVAMLFMPVTGFLGASYSGDGVSYFGVPLPGWSSRNDVLKEQFFEIHSFLAWSLVVLLGIHVLGALKHLLIDKDGVFWRMWPRQADT